MTSPVQFGVTTSLHMASSAPFRQTLPYPTQGASVQNTHPATPSPVGQSQTLPYPTQDAFKHTLPQTQTIPPAPAVQRLPYLILSASVQTLPQAHPATPDRAEQRQGAPVQSVTQIQPTPLAPLEQTLP